MPFGAELRDDGGRFRIWAPSKTSAHVVVDGVPLAMDARTEGWFERVVAGAQAGTRYAFAFGGLDVHVPDPASRFQRAKERTLPHGAGSTTWLRSASPRSN